MSVVSDATAALRDEEHKARVAEAKYLLRRQKEISNEMRDIQQRLAALEGGADPASRILDKEAETYISLRR